MHFTMLFLFSCIMLTYKLTKSEDKKYDQLWKDYKETFGKQYNNETEEKMRREIWEKNVKDISHFNMEADLGHHSFRIGINQFTEFQDGEDASAFGVIPPDTPKSRISSRSDSSPVSERALPSRFDWREHNVITPVRDQGRCEGCYAFAVTGAVEAQLAIKTKKPQELSIQQLLECGQETGLDGCKGGWPEDAYEYIRKYGQESEGCYPTKTTCSGGFSCLFFKPQQKSCSYKADCVMAHLTGYENLASNEEEMRQKLVSQGPVLVVYLATKRYMQYKSGIYQETKCDGDPNHAGLLVGFGTENGKSYWILKNSWGPKWGENGFVRILSNVNQCGLANNPSQVHVE